MIEKFDSESYIAELLTKMAKRELTPEESNILMYWSARTSENQVVFKEVSEMESLRRAIKEIYLFEEMGQ